MSAATCTLAGPATLATHTALRARIADFIAAGAGTIDWAGVDELDSSALSLIFHARRLAHAAGCVVHHDNLPAALDSLAELYGVRELLRG